MRPATRDWDTKRVQRRVSVEEAVDLAVANILKRSPAPCVAMTCRELADEIKYLSDTTLEIEANFTE